MIDSITGGTQALPERPMAKPEAAPASRPWHWLALAGITLISCFMNFYQLGQGGFGNLYYASAVKSMGMNLHNFFFVAFDPAGFVTIDKPPLGFWLQVISSKIFGFTAFSVFFPQALAGVLAVLLLYQLVQKRFGVVAGLLAALALAVSPISVVTNRNNTIDSTLALTMLIGAWAVLRSVETGKLRWLLVCALTVGLGFNIKMLEAYLVVPAFAVFYLFAAPKSFKTRILHLLLAGVVMVAFTFAWMLAVDLTPATLRPYVDSTQNNSEISLAFGYNGVTRLLGNFGGFGRARAGATTSSTGGALPSFPGGAPGTGAGAPSQGFGGAGGPFGEFAREFRREFAGGGGAGGQFGTGTAGITRLFTSTLGEQIGWILPLALLGMLALAWQRRPRFQNFQEDRQQQSLLLWGVWLLTMFIFFSVAGFFHPYYMTTMAPAVSALFGIGVVIMWRDYRNPGWRGWLLPIAFVATAAEQMSLLSRYPSWSSWLTPLIAVSIGVAIVLALVRFLPRLPMARNALVTLVSVGTLVLLVAPSIWGGVVVVSGTAQNLPQAGVTQDRGFGGGAGGGNTTNTALISYLESHQGNATYLVAVSNSNTAAPIILATGKPVMSMGGFSGSNPILTVSDLASLVAKGTVRYFLIGGGGVPGGGSGSQSVTSWVTQNCTAVPSSAWQSSSSTSTSNTGGFGGFGGRDGGAGTLYYCGTTK